MRAQTLTFAALLVGTAARAEAQAPSQRSFSGAVGVGVVALPRYAGSDEYRVLPIPVAQVEYKRRLFVGGSQSGVGAGVGAYVIRTSALSVDVGLAGSESRPESRGDALAGMGRRAAGSFATTGVTYRLAGISATAGAAVGLGDDQGSYGTLGLSGERQLASRWVGGLSTGATLADGKNMAFEFGVTPTQSSARRTLAAAGDARLRGIATSAYAPGGGLREVRGGASLAYLLTTRTRVVAFAQGTHLAREAGRSPLVRQRDGATTGMALAYGF